MSHRKVNKKATTIRSLFIRCEGWDFRLCDLPAEQSTGLFAFVLRQKRSAEPNGSVFKSHRKVNKKGHDDS